MSADKVSTSCHKVMLELAKNFNFKANIEGFLSSLCFIPFLNVINCLTKASGKKFTIFELLTNFYFSN